MYNFKIGTSSQQKHSTLWGIDKLQSSGPQVIGCMSCDLIDEVRVINVTSFFSTLYYITSD